MQRHILALILFLACTAPRRITVSGVDIGVDIEWSRPSLIGGTATHLPPALRGVKGPIGFGQNFRAFDSRHYLGPAFNNTWAFTSDAGATWRAVDGAVVSERPSKRKPTGIDSDGWAAIT